MQDCPHCGRATIIDYSTRASNAAPRSAWLKNPLFYSNPSGPIVNLNTDWLKDVHKRIELSDLSVGQASDFVKLLDVERNRPRLTRDVQSLAPLIRDIVDEIDRSANTQPKFWTWVFRAGAITGIALGLNELPVSSSMLRAYNWAQEWILKPGSNKDEPSDLDDKVGWDKPTKEI